MDIFQLQDICIEVFGDRNESGKQAQTGAAGHIKKRSHVAEDKRLYLALQGGAIGKKAHSFMKSTNALIAKKYKERGADDCRSNVITHLKKGEWTGFHAETIIVSRWIKLMFPACTTVTDIDRKSIVTAFRTGEMMIAANAPCCKHCHNLLNYLEIEHPEPVEIKHSLTGWWNPLTNVRTSNGDADFQKDIPGL